jgi:hypothetical protein
MVHGSPRGSRNKGGWFKKIQVVRIFIYCRTRQGNKHKKEGVHMLHSCPYKQDLVSYCKESIDYTVLEVS